MKRSFYVVYLFALLVAAPSFACLPLGEKDQEPFDSFRTSVMELSRVARWFKPSIQEIIDAKIQEHDKEKNNCFYSETDYIDFICQMGRHSPHENLAFENILMVTNDIVTNTVLTLIPVDRTQKNYILSPGFSHGYVNALQQIALENAHALANGLPSLIQVGDVGAGHGFASQHFLLAGAHHASAPHAHDIPLKGVRVTAIEQHLPLLKSSTGHGPLMYAFSRAKKISITYEKSGARARDYYAVVQSDAASILNQDRFQNYFNLLYLGNMLHYCDPQHAQRVLSGVYSALQPGAQAYASVHTALFLPHLEIEKGDPFEIYQQQYKAGKKFPGWMMLNNMAPIKNESIGESMHRQAHPLNEDNDAFAPTQQKGGWYNVQTNANIAKGRDGSMWMMSHQSLQIYDALSLRGLFERNSFLVEDLFFEDPRGRRIEVSALGLGDGRFTCAQDTQKATRVCIVARKPCVIQLSS
jgi:hypothetical protein